MFYVRTKRRGNKLLCRQTYVDTRIKVRTSVALVLTIAGYLLAADGAPAKAGKISTSTADHAKFEQLKGPFAQGAAVTRACLSCHTEAARQIQATMHWTWEPAGKSVPGAGKRRMINNY